MKKWIVGTDYGCYPEVQEFDEYEKALETFNEWKEDDWFRYSNVYLAEVIIKHEREDKNKQL